MDERIPWAEGIEAMAMADLHAAAGPELTETLGLGLIRHGSALVETSRCAPGHGLVNRAIGLGVGGRARLEDVAAILEQFRAEGIERGLVHVVPQPDPPELRRWLTAKGLAPEHRGWVKFTRGPQPPPPARTELAVEPCGPERAGDFGRIVAASFGLPEAMAAVYARIVGRDAWHAYVTVDEEGVTAGTAAAFLHGDLAWFSFAATAEPHRGRGSQGALLARRIADAIELGVARFVTETGEAEGDDPQHSYRNIERAGFVAAYLRENWCPRREG